jgi:hypothetical protein
MIEIIDAIFAIDPNAEVVLPDGDNVDAFIWHSAEIPKADILAKQLQLQSEYDSLSYSRARADAYASLPDQADMQYWDAINGTTVWKDHIADIKSKHPKENK